MRKRKVVEQLRASFGQVKREGFQFDLIERYFLNKENSDSFQVLSDKTCHDIDFEELFMFLDKTCSKVGQQYLYNHLRVIPNALVRIDQKERLIERLTTDIDLRIKTQLLLKKLDKGDAYYIASLFQEEHQKPPRWFFLVYLLSAAGLLSLLMLPLYPQLFLVFLGVMLLNMGIHYWNKKNLYRYVGSIPQLLQLNSIAQHLFKEELFQPIDPELPVAIRMINQVRNRMSFFRLEARIQGDAEAVLWGILELLKITFLLEPLLLFGVLKRLDSKRKEIERVFRFVGEIDLLISIASLRKGVSMYCLPEIDDSEFSAKKVYHPLISNCVPNSITVSDKSVLLTGSNMSGKTTFIRAIGINVITGLTINTCFAEAISIPRLRIHSAIRISDDLMNDKSYYFEEVLTIKEMIDSSSLGSPCLFLLDELFKGTNTIERISAGKAVLSKLSKNGNRVFVSTHDLELTEMLTDEYDLYHFSEVVIDRKVDFDYRLKKGKLTSRNAIRILQVNDYPSDLIDEAMDISKKMDDNALVKTL